MGRSKKDTGNWLITYSDMVTLLLVFFVVLYMLTPGVDMETLQQFLERFRGATGVLQQEQTTIERPTSPDGRDEEDLRQERLERWQALVDFIEDRQLDEFFEIDLIPEGIRITLSESVTFDSGSSVLLPQARMILGEIAELFSDDIYETEVQGHTDNVPLRETAYYRSNWDLGASRAISVVRFIKDISDLPPERFKASSYGEYHPIAANETPSGRQTNRRVEIYVRYDDEYIDLEDHLPAWQREVMEEG